MRIISIENGFYDPYGDDWFIKATVRLTRKERKSIRQSFERAETYDMTARAAATLDRLFDLTGLQGEFYSGPGERFAHRASLSLRGKTLWAYQSGGLDV
jgi:hypothetical protein